jgi:TatD DNase family protein
VHPDVVPLIDTHAHLDDEQFSNDLAEVVRRAADAGLSHIVTIATTAASSRRSIALAGQYPLLWASVGIHPNNAAEAGPGDWDEVLSLADGPRVVAVGETGLDRHWDFTPFQVQEDYFARHLSLARQKGKPVVIHCREAEEDVLRMLREDFESRGPIRGVMHSFAGSRETAEACLAMGLYLSFAGMLTYKNADALRAVAARVPLDRLLVETDSPYLSPVPLRGRRNEPAHVVHTAARLAELQGIPADELAEATTRNARALFGLPA